jgi:ankyrin repeat protein
MFTQKPEEITTLQICGYIYLFFNTIKENFYELSCDEQTRLFWKFFVNFRDKMGRRPIHYAAQKGHANMVTMSAKEYGVDVNVRDNNGLTPMHHAAAHGQTNVVTLLAKEYGVDVNVRDKDGFTPMHYATGKGQTNVVTLLAKEYGVDVNFRDKYGWTPMHYAANRGLANMVTLLAKEYGVDVNVRSNGDYTPMHHAAARGHVNVVTLLAKEYNADVNVRSNGDYTPMHSAARGGHGNVVTLLAKEHGVNVNVRDKYGRTPMHYAAQKGHVNVVTLLAKEYGVDVNVQSSWGRGWTPMQYAAQEGHVNVVTLLTNLAKKKMKTCKKRKAPPGAGSSSQYQTKTTETCVKCEETKPLTEFHRPRKCISCCKAERKWCVKCKETKPRTEFHKLGENSYSCKMCHNAYVRELRKLRKSDLQPICLRDWYKQNRGPPFWSASYNVIPRRRILHRIVEMLKGLNKNCSETWTKKLQDRARHFEELLYKRAPNKQVYEDISTLKVRLLRQKPFFPLRVGRFTI